MDKNKLIHKLDGMSIRSKWRRGVRLYAIELLEDFEENEIFKSPYCKKALLNGATDWCQYSEGGCSLIYDVDIAKRLCTPSELKKCDNGHKPPNSRESWLDVQARALYQANNMIFHYISD